MLQYRFDSAGPMGIDALAAELVALQTASGHGSGGVLRAGRRVADAKNRPIALGHVPSQFAVGPEMRSQFDDAISRHGCRSRHFLGIRLQTVLILPAPKGLGRQLLDARLAGGSRKREHGDIAVIVQLGFRLRQTASKCDGPFAFVSLTTTVCIAWAGLIQGPPLLDQPAQLWKHSSRPSRSASVAA